MTNRFSYKAFVSHFYFRAVALLVTMYLFLVSIKVLSSGLNLMGSGLAQPLFEMTSNPFAGLMTGILATVLFQSSSVTSSIIVGLVGSGTLSVGGAVPMIMGANIGTSVTNTLVSLSFWADRQNFKRAFAAATVHDFFNFLSVAILLPLEMATGFIERLATFFAGSMYGFSSGLKFSSPIKAAIKPLAGWIKATVVATSGDSSAPLVLIVLSGVLIVISLSFVIKVMRSYVSDQEDSFIENVLSKSPYGAVLCGIVLTFMAQSSSITTAILVPLAGSGLLSLQSIYPVTIGANIGTTGTALFAALAGNVSGMAIALVHLIFNLMGTLIFFVHPSMRKIPVWCSSKLAQSIDGARYVGFGYIAFVFFIFPISMIYITR